MIFGVWGSGPEPGANHTFALHVVTCRLAFPWAVVSFRSCWAPSSGLLCASAGPLPCARHLVRPGVRGPCHGEKVQGRASVAASSCRCCSSFSFLQDGSEVRTEPAESPSPTGRCLLSETCGRFWIGQSSLFLSILPAWRVA